MLRWVSLPAAHTQTEGAPARRRSRRGLGHARAWRRLGAVPFLVCARGGGGTRLAAFEPEVAGARGLSAGPVGAAAAAGWWAAA